MNKFEANKKDFIMLFISTFFYFFRGDIAVIGLAAMVNSLIICYLLFIGYHSHSSGQSYLHFIAGYRCVKVKFTLLFR